MNGAIQTYERALALAPNNPVILYRLGYTYARVNKVEQAEKYLREALKIDPQFADAEATLGYVFTAASPRD